MEAMKNVKKNQKILLNKNGGTGNTLKATTKSKRAN